jgi:hypothetical protein
MSALSQRPRVPTKATRRCAEQSAAADCLQRPLLRRSRFRQRLSRSVGRTRRSGGRGDEAEGAVVAALTVQQILQQGYAAFERCHPLPA